MKLEFDLSNRSELQVALRVINAALGECGSVAQINPLAGAPEGMETPKLLVGLPKEFTTPQAIAYGETIGFSSPAVRSEIARLLGAGWIVEKIPASGRRPATFSKTR